MPSFPLALALIVAPEPVEGPDPALMGPVKLVALHLELMDPREDKWVFNNPADFGSDLLLIRQRYTELWDAPPACDALRLPGPELCRELISQNRQYRTYLEDKQALFGTVESFMWIQEALEETNYLYQVWSEVRDSRSDYFYLTVRRKALKTLRELIGPVAYYGGFLPPHVPTWRLRRTD